MPKFLPEIRQGDKTLEHADCENCPLKTRLVVPCSKAKGKPKMIVLGEFPGEEEEQKGEIFNGKKGEKLDTALEEAGLTRDKVHITNTIMCRPSAKMQPKAWKKAIQCCRNRLFKELEATGCKTIVGLGEKALKVITGKTKIFQWVGSPIKGLAFAIKTKRSRKTFHEGDLVNFRDYTIFPTFSPSSCMRSPAYYPVFYTHFIRAKQLFLGEIDEWKWPEIVYKVEPRMLEILEEIYDEGLPIAIDIETLGKDPLESKISCLSVANINKSVSIPWESYPTKFGWVSGILEYGRVGNKIRDQFFKILESPLPKIFQNGQHDILGIKKQFGIDMTETYIFDTLLAHAVISPRIKHGLDFIACCESIAPRWKSEFKVSSDTKGLDTFVQRKEYDLRLYNAKDAFMTIFLYYSLKEQLEEREELEWEHSHRLILMKIAMRMKEVGVYIDLTKKDELEAIITTKRDEALVKLREVANNPNFNPHALAQTRQLFFETLEIKPTRYTNTGLASLDEEVLKSFLAKNEKVREAAKTLLTFRQWNKLLSTYITGLPIKDKLIHCDWKVYGTRTGRWAARDPALQTIPKSFKYQDKKYSIRDIIVPRPGSYLLKADYCVAPHTKILTTGLDWVPANKLKPNQEIIAFPEKLGTNHNFQKAKVLNFKKLLQPCYEIITEDSRIVCSADHKLLKCTNGRNRQWIEAKHLKIKDNLVFLIEPWYPLNNYHGGWLAGASDGECYIGNRITFSQNKGETLDKFKNLLDWHGIKYYETKKRFCRTVRMSSVESMKFLGMTKPVRLMKKSNGLWEGKRTYGGVKKSWSKIKEINYLGEQEVIALKTSTGTMIAEGFLSHNSQLELRIIALLAGDQGLIETFTSGGDVHKANALDLFGSYDEDKRKMGKMFVYLVNYGGSINTLHKNFSIDYNLSYKFVSQLYNKWFKTHPELRQFQNDLIRTARKSGYVECPLSGRRQYYLDGEIDYSEVLNFPIQGTGSDIVDKAIITINNKINWQDELILLQAHDEIVTEAQDPIKMFRIMKESMEQEIELGDYKMNFPIDISIGKSWFNTEDIKTEEELEAWLLKNPKKK